MILNKKAKNRLGIYYFKDKDGIFDSSYAFLLEKISKHFDKLVFVYNGELSDISKKKILKFTDIILKCEKGYRPNAYKLGYNFLSTEEKEVYDEILFFDNSLLGPFYSLDNMFDSMDKKDIDFWGLHWIY